MDLPSMGGSKGRMDTRAVAMVVSLVLALFTIGVMQGALNNLLGGTSEQKQSDDIESLANRITSVCSEVNSERPVSTKANMELELTRDTVLEIRNGELVADFGDTDSTLSYSLHEDCTYNSGFSFTADDRTTWQAGIDGDPSSQEVVLNICNPDDLSEGETCV